MRNAVLAEFAATAFLLIAVVGSGIAAERLCGGNAGLALLVNAAATGCALFALILAFGPISGAHMNPAVTVAAAILAQLPWRSVAPYVIAQVLGALAGVGLAHAMFDLPVVQLSAHIRTGPAQWVAEIVATAGLLGLILRCHALGLQSTAGAVAAYITGAYWFTASTSFANPAVTFARAFTDTFAGIRPQDAPAFVAAQFIALALVIGAARALGFSLPAPQLERLMNIVVHHNPDCGTSRNVLRVIAAAGYVPTVIEYLQIGWTRAQLLGLFAAAGLTPRSALRETKSPARDMGLLEPDVSPDTILDMMVAHRVLVNRPIVCTPRGVRLCRPSERVLDLLDRLPPGPFFKEDGALLIDDQGRRVG